MKTPEEIKSEIERLKNQRMQSISKAIECLGNDTEKGLKYSREAQSFTDMIKGLEFSINNSIEICPKCGDEVNLGILKKLYMCNNLSCDYCKKS